MLWYKKKMSSVCKHHTMQSNVEWIVSVLHKSLKHPKYLLRYSVQVFFFITVMLGINFCFQLEEPERPRHKCTVQKKTRETHREGKKKVEENSSLPASTENKRPTNKTRLKWLTKNLSYMYYKSIYFMIHCNLKIAHSYLIHSSITHLFLQLKLKRLDIWLIRYLTNYDRSVSGDLKLLEKQKVSFSESISV